jgi:hypothetical protein
MVRYRVKPDRAADNEELVRAVYDELARIAPDGFRYMTNALEDGVSFVHIAEGDFALGQLESFGRFREGIADRCDEPPVTTELREIGSYRWG